MDTDYSEYVNEVLDWYIALPDTPNRFSRSDCQVAIQLCQRQISLSIIESAFLLALSRRHLRDPKLQPLGPVRSLSYFLPVIDEILASSLPSGYVDYLRYKLRRHNIFPSTQAPAQKVDMSSEY
jgi:hypothetical protein